MTGKVLDRDATGILVIILPLAVAIVVLFTAWQWILLCLGLIIAWQFWKTYQWRQWCQRVNPFFNQLIQENRGLLTPIELSSKTNMTARSAKRFLEKKAEEFGAQRKVEDGGTVYYFLTSKALGGIFDDSEPTLEDEESEALAQKKIPQIASASSIVTKPVKADADEPKETLANTVLKPEEATATQAEQELLSEALEPLENLLEDEEAKDTEELETQETVSQKQETSAIKLIQADLAKRLDINPSTLVRRRGDPDFPEWSQSKDPEGIAWKYVPKTKMFVPVETE